MATIIWDDGCRFCRASADWLRYRSDAILVPASAWPGGDAGIGADALSRSLHSVDGTTVRSGARAVAVALRAGRSPGLRVAGAALDAPPVRPVAAAAYHLVASNRAHLSRLVRWWCGEA